MIDGGICSVFVVPFTFMNLHDWLLQLPTRVWEQSTTLEWKSCLGCVRCSPLSPGYSWYDVSVRVPQSASGPLTKSLTVNLPCMTMMRDDLGQLTERNKTASCDSLVMREVMGSSRHGDVFKRTGIIGGRVLMVVDGKALLHK